MEGVHARDAAVARDRHQVRRAAHEPDRRPRRRGWSVAAGLGGGTCGRQGRRTAPGTGPLPHADQQGHGEYDDLPRAPGVPSRIASERACPGSLDRRIRRRIRATAYGPSASHAAPSRTGTWPPDQARNASGSVSAHAADASSRTRTASASPGSPSMRTRCALRREIGDQQADARLGLDREAPDPERVARLQGTQRPVSPRRATSANTWNIGKTWPGTRREAVGHRRTRRPLDDAPPSGRLEPRDRRGARAPPARSAHRRSTRHPAATPGAHPRRGGRSPGAAGPAGYGPNRVAMVTGLMTMARSPARRRGTSARTGPSPRRPRGSPRSTRRPPRGPWG